CRVRRRDRARRRGRAFPRGVVGPALATHPAPAADPAADHRARSAAAARAPGANRGTRVPATRVTKGDPLPVRIVTDSAADLPDDLAAELAITVVPLTIRFGDEELVDRRELSPEDFYARLATSPMLPETA